MTTPDTADGHEQARLRELLDDAVADVEPRRGLDEIQSRTRSGRSHGSWVWGAGGAILATAATVAAVAVLGGGSDTTDVGPGPAARSTPAQVTVPVFYVGDTGAGPRLFREVATTDAGIDSGLARAVDEAVTGAAEDPDYRTPWPAGTTLQQAQLSDRVLSVDLGGSSTERPAGLTPAEAELALQQLVYTAQAASGRHVPVTFLLDGRRTQSVIGVATDRPVAAASGDGVLAPVSVSAPGEGVTLSSPFTVTGEASAFEANVQWELMQGNTVVKHGFTTAQECCTLSPYSFTVDAAPGRYTLVVHDEDASGGEGTPSSLDSKEITVG